MEQMTLDTILKVSAAITGAIIGWMAVLRRWDTHKAKKAESGAPVKDTEGGPGLPAKVC